ncbi:hypothetical protein pb186bvf_005640 [Paramecium bursaria]
MGTCECKAQEINQKEIQPLQVADVTDDQKYLQEYVFIDPDDHQPPKNIKLSNLPFQTTNPLVQKLLDELGLIQLEDNDEGYMFGIYEDESGSKGKRSGFAAQIWSDGSIYEGIWKCNQANGFGRMIYSDGDYYEGEWVEDLSIIIIKILQNKEKGHITIMMGASIKEIGSMIFKTVMVRKGFSIKQSLVANTKLERSMVKGNFEWPDGSVYEGEFRNGQFHGEGTYIWSDDRRYTGEWVNGQMEGLGRDDLA